MANEEQLFILKQGAEVWNRSSFKGRPDLREADLIRANLSGASLFDAELWRADLREANLTNANLWRADLREANLERANLSGANLWEGWLQKANLAGANLTGANLKEAMLTGADLRETKLIEADLRLANLIKATLKGADFSRALLSVASLLEADLTGAILVEATLNGAGLEETKLMRANLSYADLTHASLKGANLSGATLTGAKHYRTFLGEADLNGADLSGSDFDNAIIVGTIFRNLDLREVRGLRNVFHNGPSSVSTDTFVRSKGKIPEVFLRGCGLSDWEIELVKLYNPDLGNEERNKILYRIYDLQGSQAIQISPLFISYSHADTEFVDKMGDDLTKRGIRYWRDIHDMKSGRIEKQIDRAIRQNPTVLLVFSKNSLNSDWVEHEVRTARELEKEMGRDVLCPVALDDSWKSSAWPKRVMEQIMEYNILDFSAWRDDNKFEDMFRKLIDGLELFYKG